MANTITIKDYMNSLKSVYERAMNDGQGKTNPKDNEDLKKDLTWLITTWIFTPGSDLKDTENSILDDWKKPATEKAGEMLINKEAQIKVGYTPTNMALTIAGTVVSEISHAGGLVAGIINSFKDNPYKTAEEAIALFKLQIEKDKDEMSMKKMGGLKDLLNDNTLRNNRNWPFLMLVCTSVGMLQDQLDQFLKELYHTFNKYDVVIEGIVKKIILSKENFTISLQKVETALGEIKLNDIILPEKTWNYIYPLSSLLLGGRLEQVFEIAHRDNKGKG